MAAAPEEFLFVHPDPPSPSVFLDLPPTPPHDDDMALPYIARLLMDEEAAGADSFFYQYPDHPALLQAQLPFAQILSDSAASPSVSADTEAETVASPAADHATDMVTSAFLKGVEEATKFLPTTDALLLDRTSSLGEVLNGGHARGRKNNRHAAGYEDAAADADPEPEARRATKLAAPEPDEAAVRQMFDDMMLRERDICMKGVQQRRRLRRRRHGDGDGDTAADGDAVDLHALLLRCAQAVAADDRRGAHDLLAQVRRHSSPTGDAAQRLAHCFAEGLEARLAGTGSRLYRSLMVRPTSAVDFLKAYQLFLAACCCKKVAFTFSNKTFSDAAAGRRRLHIVDYGIGYGFQWPGLLRGLAARHGGPPEVRITGIDLPQPGFRPAYQIEETGRRLATCARELGVPFRFRGIAARRETVSPEDLELDPGEVLVVIGLCHFRHLMDESVVVGRPSPRDEVLGNIRRMRPDVFVHGVVNGGYGGGAMFPTRFRELLFYWSAQFDLLEATVPRESQERLLVERDIFGRSAVDVIACEGADRVERPETYRQWQARNRRAGLRQLPLKAEVVKVVLDKVREGTLSSTRITHGCCTGGRGVCSMDYPHGFRTDDVNVMLPPSSR